ncbi:hypothetical protein ACWD4F_17505 [Streptomyces aureus]|uniref:hypothetical protein n=1 Tax=Streptomyces aureus TaxID=193461 RepID=UPI00131E42B0|nr:hypothetical protein [Streptomyces aureus]
MILVDNEIGLVRWADLSCGCGANAAHLPADLRRFFEARTRDEAMNTGVAEHVLIQSFPQEPAVAVTGVLMAGLASDLPLAARVEALDLLLRLVFNDDDDASEACQDIARNGAWVLYSDLVANRSPALTAYAFQILQVIDPGERLEALKSSGQISLPSDLVG